MLERIEALLAPGAADAYATAVGRAQATPQPTLAAMAEATIAIWGTALGRRAVAEAAQPVSAARCLAALHYAAWSPSRADAPGEGPAPLPGPKPNGALAFVARAALSIRHTLPGRVLYRLAPKPLVDALRQRL
jgi:hypothetical protein